MYSKILLVLVFIFVISTYSQTTDTVYSFSVDLGGSYSHYLTTLQFEKLNKNGFGGTIRLMWHPEHLLSLGLESGYLYLYWIRSTIQSDEFGTSSLKASMISIPVLFVTSMVIFPESLPNLEVNGGGGMYFMFNNVQLFGSKINSSVFSLGYHAGITYLQPLSKDISIGAEIKYYYISKLQDAAISAKLLFSYNFLSY